MYYQHRQASDQSIYYIVEGRPYWNKNSAYYACQGDPKKLMLYFMDHYFDNNNLSEPRESWEQLCITRAKQIRDKYDIVSIFCSGGFDSNTVIDSFIKANCLIDELIVIDKSRFYYDPEPPEAKRVAQWYKQNYNSNLIITVIDLDEKYYKEYYSKYKYEWINKGPFSHRFTKSGTMETTDLINHRMHIQRKFPGKSHNYVLAHDNAFVDLRDGKWFMWQIDSTLYTNIGDGAECFFYSHELPAIHLKQTYMAIRFFESIPNISHELVHRILGHDKAYYEKYKLAIGRVPCKLYFSRHAIGKEVWKHCVDSPDSQKILKHFLSDNKKIYDYYMEGLRECRHKILGEENLSDVLPTTTSKQWYIRQFHDQINTVDCLT